MGGQARRCRAGGHVPESSRRAAAERLEGQQAQSQHE